MRPWQKSATLRHDRKVRVAYLALADLGPRQVHTTVLVMPPGLAAANDLPSDAEDQGKLRVDLDADGRLYGVEILWPEAQLPRALATGDEAGDRLLTVRRDALTGTVSLPLDASAEVAASVAVERAAGGAAPQLSFDGEGRLVAVVVPDPDVQLRPELLTRVTAA